VGPDERAAAEAELENVVLRHQLAILRRQVNLPGIRQGVPRGGQQGASAGGVERVPGPA